MGRNLNGVIVKVAMVKSGFTKSDCLTRPYQDFATAKSVERIYINKYNDRIIKINNWIKTGKFTN